MVLEDAQQAVAAAERMLAAVRDGAVASGELRAALEASRVFMATAATFQTAAAELIAARERHGDGGAEVLAVSVGLSQSEAHSQVKTAQLLRQVPKLQEAVQSGEVPQANARKLADAITKTGSAAVAGDAELLKQASSMRPEQFKHSAQRWIASQQTDNGASEHARQRARRNLRIFDLDDGMVCLRGEFDKITGTRIRNRLRYTAEKFLNNDKKQLPKDQRREFTQCMADALDHATNRVSTNRKAGHDKDARAADGVKTSGAAGGGWVADITLVAHVDDATGELITELSDGSRLPDAVLEELSCNTRWTGLVYDRVGDAIWRSRSRRTVTDSQWQTLLTDYGGCFHCGAPPQMCQAHHITPYSQGGETSVKNMVMVCWNCHHKIHHHNWHIQTHTDGHHTLHPPDNKLALQPRYGPAHAENQQQPTPKSSPRHGRSPARTKKNRTSQTRTNARNPATNQKGRSNRNKDPAPATLW